MRDRTMLRGPRVATLLVAVAVAVSACATPATSTAPSGLPSASPVATATNAAPGSMPPSSGALPTAGPTATAAVGTIPVIPPGSAVAVAVAELNVREGPTTSSKRLVTLKRGDVLVVGPAVVLTGWGPVKANGYTWYPVIQPGQGPRAWTLEPLPAYPIDTGDGSTITGWVAADDGSASYVTAVAPRCPTTVDLANVSGMLPAERIGCFNAPFVLEGTYGCGGCGGAVAGVYEPDWLASPMQFGFLSVDPNEQLGPLAVSFQPGRLPELAAASIVRMTVHVNDPLSDTCKMSELDGEKLVPIHHDTAVFYCRERVVVDSYEVIGTDPDFPLG